MSKNSRSRKRGRTSIISDAEIFHVSNVVGSQSYMKLGLELGFGYRELENIKTEKTNFQEALMAVLANWKENQGKEIDQRAVLADCLRKSRLGELAELILKEQDPELPKKFSSKSKKTVNKARTAAAAPKVPSTFNIQVSCDVSKISNILALQNVKSQPVFKKVRAQVIASKVEKYTWQGKEKKYRLLGIADDTGAMKARLYDDAKLKICLKDANILILQCPIREDKYTSEKYLLITEKMEVINCSMIDIPKEFRMAAKRLVNPPAAKTISIADVSKAPTGNIVSVRGVLRKVGSSSIVMVNSTPTSVRSVTIKDSTGSCTLSLWRDLAKDPRIEEGENMSFSNVKITEYDGVKSLSTIDRKTKIRILSQFKLKLKIEGYLPKEEGVISLVTDDHTKYDVECSVLAEYFKTTADEVMDALKTQLPPEICGHFTRNKITKLSD